ncbi:MAG: helix-turn-helix domain-containing protein [Oleiphilaceae bacterium]|nr:helix-turn-helix domain-containing protein [Oleiphilaceae bacterium]
MTQATILCFEDALATSIIGISDLLGYCGVTWNYINREALSPRFEVMLASRDSAPVQCVNGIRLDTHQSLSNWTPTEIVIVPTIGGNISKCLENNPDIIDYLIRAHEQGSLVASNCTGAFFLAEAGLLDGKEATTHWGFTQQFTDRYPLVDLKPEKLLTRSGNILCSAGGHACFDMGLYLIERYHGREQAIQSSKSFVLDMGRQRQLTYSPLETAKHHRDDLVRNVQCLLEENYQERLSLSEVANTTGLSERTLLRRFKRATGDSPSAYLQLVRLEKARQLLELSDLSVAEIVLAVGYEDVSSFTKLFKRKTGLNPGQYRDRYGARFRVDYE